MLPIIRNAMTNYYDQISKTVMRVCGVGKMNEKISESAGTFLGHCDIENDAKPC